MNTVLKLLTLFLPWSLRRRLLIRIWGYKIDPTARIGLAWVFPRQLSMAAHSIIDHLTVCKDLDRLELGEYAIVGRLNWITGYPSGPSRHFSHEPDRTPVLVVGNHSAITNRHLIDCTAAVEIGDFTTFAGFQSQILTHSIDLEHGRQSSAPVRIGSYCFVGTNCVILGGSRLPDYSVLGAKSLLKNAFGEEYGLYAGVPATRRKSLSPGFKYFQRTEGFVW